ncbi:MAG TPA: phenylalanine--tRNA ligase subunit beta [Sedimentisphaerales bacterium]|nr:phenylalanine--tRNA ligase subunit beta [Sedimentisphaerales bacterium]
MKVSLDWLKDYVEIEHSAAEVAEMLSDLGLGCEGIEYCGDDAVIDVEITSNRGDCLGYIGVARELSVATDRELKLPDIELDELDRDAAGFCSVEIVEPDLCGRYTARIIEGVRVGPSPNWMAKRLEAAGLRSVNNVVDATNYAMLETGQPPHAFDYARINEGKIIVRRAVAGERIVSIDGTQCDLESDMLIIADPKGPVAIAGVMGGLETEVSNATTAILLEDAYFDPLTVRRTSRRLVLPSEAAFRFERIVDIENVDWASKRTAQLIVQVAGGKVAKGVVDAYPKMPAKRQVTLRFSRVAKLLGMAVPVEQVMRILSVLSFEPRKENDLIVCTAPSWRSDVYREVDLIEEVARVYGYDRVPVEKRISIEVTPVDARQRLAESIGRYLNGCGFYEAVTVGFVDDWVSELFAADDGKGYLAVQDASRKTANLLRRTLIGSLLGVLKTNVNARNLPCRVYEIADTFLPGDGRDDVLPNEQARVALVCDGDFRYLRGVIEGLARNVSREAEVSFRPADLAWAQTGAEVVVDGKVMGTAGIVSQSVTDRYGFKEVTPVAAELQFEELLALQSGPVKVKPIPRFPAIERDLSIIVDEMVPWAEIVEAVSSKAPGELEDVRFVDIYRGKGIPSGKKSVTLSLRFRDEDGTLTHDTVDDFEKAIVESLAERVKAELRTV